MLEPFAGHQNFFRCLGDMALAATVLIPLIRFAFVRPASKGISLDTALLHLVAFVLKYLDITSNGMFYNLVMKLIFITGSTVLVLGLIFARFRDPAASPALRLLDFTLPLLLVSLAAGLPFNYTSSSYDTHPSKITRALENPQEWLWACAIYLTAVADVPQMALALETRDMDGWVACALLAWAEHRVWYGLNWYSRYEAEGLMDPIAWTGAAVHFLLLVGFALAYKFQRKPAAVQLDEESQEQVPQVAKPLLVEVAQREFGAIGEKIAA